MWPEHINQGPPPGDEPGEGWPPFDLDAAVRHEALLDPSVDQEEATRRAWVAWSHRNRWGHERSA